MSGQQWSSRGVTVIPIRHRQPPDLGAGSERHPPPTSPQTYSPGFASPPSSAYPDLHSPPHNAHQSPTSPTTRFFPGHQRSPNSPAQAEYAHHQSPRSPPATHPHPQQHSRFQYAPANGHHVTVPLHSGGVHSASHVNSQLHSSGAGLHRSGVHSSPGSHVMLQESVENVISEHHHHHHQFHSQRSPPPSPGSSYPTSQSLAESSAHRSYVRVLPSTGGWGSAATQEHRESQVKQFAAMQNSDNHRHPDYDYDYNYDYSNGFCASIPAEFLPPPAGDDITGPQEFGSPVPDYPVPDYDPDTPVAERNSFVFVEKFKDVICNIRTIEELYSDIPEPDPDYQDEDSSDFPPPPPPISGDSLPPPPPSEASPTSPTDPVMLGMRNGAGSSPEEEGEIIQPKKLVNPCLASRERQAVHKELLMNYKLGKNVLQKPELNKVLAKRKETQKRKEWEVNQISKRTSLELKLEERAQKLKEKDMKTISEDDKAPEFVQMHRRITTKTPTSPPT